MPARDTRLDRLVLGYRSIGMGWEAIAQLVGRSTHAVKRRYTEARKLYSLKWAEREKFRKLQRMWAEFTSRPKPPKPKPAKRRKTLLWEH